MVLLATSAPIPPNNAWKDEFFYLTNEERVVYLFHCMFGRFVSNEIKASSRTRSNGLEEEALVEMLCESGEVELIHGLLI